VPVSFWLDLRYAGRMMRRAPGFAAVAILTLALGIGANTAIFSVIHGVWLSPAHYPGGDRLVDISMKQLTGRRFERGASWADLQDWKHRVHAFADFGLHRYNFETNVTGAGDAEELVTHRVSSNLLSVLGVAPVLGHGFTPDNDTASGPRSALIAYGYWQRRFGGDPAAIGKTIAMNGEPFTITGVMPPEFQFPPAAGADWNPVIWLSLNLPPDQLRQRDYRALSVVARLKPGFSLRQASSEMEVIVSALAKAYPKESADYGVKVSPLQETRPVVEARPTFLLLMGAAAFVMLIACVNLANLLLARAAGRQREFAVRRALGAGRLRLARQLLAEALLLSIAGGLAGVLIARWALPALKALMPGSMPRVSEIAIQLPVFAFAAALSLGTGLLFGLAPAWQAVGSRGLAGSRYSARQRPARVLLTAEVALAMVLLSGAGLLIESFRRASTVDMGFERQHVLTMRVELNRGRYSTAQRIESFREELLHRASAIPGVRSAGTVSTLPLGILGANTDFEVDGRSETAPYSVVTPGYLRALGMAVLRGRDFSETDHAGAHPVTIVSESLARRCWPGADPLGKRVRMGSTWFTVAGVVKDVRQNHPDAEPEANIYALAAQLPPERQTNINARFMVLVLRTAADPAAVASAVRAAVAQIDKDQPVADVQTMEQRIQHQLAGRRLNTLLLAIFAALALTLAAVGVFGVVSYSVARRTSEIGIRMALGARPAAVLAMIAGETLRLALVGVALGVAGTLAVSRLLAGFLYGVRPADPGILAAVAVLLVAVVAAAGLSPAIRAMRVDPVLSLRAE